MSKMSEKVRHLFNTADDARDAGLTAPEDVVRYMDILYGTEAPCQQLDVYRPKCAPEKTLPVIVSVHGGGWVYGDKQRYQYYCMSLAQRGFAVVNFTYRLAPEYKFPAQLEDTNAAFCWVLQHAEEYGFDTAHVFAVGDSAGAHLLGLFLGICTDPAYAAKYAFHAPEGFVPKAVALNCGAYKTSGVSLRTRMLMADLLPHKGTPAEVRQISALQRVNGRFPPVFLMTCTGDFLHKDAACMSQALMKHGVAFLFRFYGDSKTELGHVFHCNVRSAAGRQCNDDECAFFRSFCDEA